MTTTQTKTKVSTKTVIATLIIAGAGLLAAAANMAMPPTAARPPALLVRATPAQPRAIDVTRGTEDVTLLSVDLLPGGGNATVSRLAFSVFGDLDANFASIARDANAADRFASCLLADSTGATVAGPEAVSGGLVTFTDSFTVLSGVVTPYAVRCDLSATATADGTPDRFAASIAGESAITASIGGTALSGSSLVIGGTTADTLNDTGIVSVRVSDEGRLAIRIGTDTPESDIVLGSTSGVDAGHWELNPSGEDFTVDTLTFNNVGSSAAIASVVLSCRIQDGSTNTYRSFLSAGRVAFTGTDCFAYSETGSTLALSVDTNAVGSTGAASGDTFRFVLNALDSGTFSATGMFSGTAYDETDIAATVSAQQMVLRKTKPAFALSSSSPSGAGVPGNSEVLRFNVSAASTGDVAVNQLVFRVTATDMAGSEWQNCGTTAPGGFASGDSWHLYDLSDASTSISDEGDWSFLEDDGLACGASGGPVGYAILSLGADATTGALDIAAGSAKTLMLKVDTTGASATSDDTVRFELLNESDARAIGHSAVLWNDDAEATNINASLLQALPVNGGTISY